MLSLCPLEPIDSEGAVERSRRRSGAYEGRRPRGAVGGGRGAAAPGGQLDESGGAAGALAGAAAGAGGGAAVPPAAVRGRGGWDASPGWRRHVAAAAA